MEQNISEKELLNSVQFLFAKPYFQGHYMYAMDDLNSMSVIEKNELKNLLCKLHCGDFEKINYLMDRNYPFFFDVKEKKLKEFELTQELTKDDINKMITEEIKSNIQTKETSNYERFFGKESNFYKINFNEERFNQWQSLTNTKQFTL